MNSSYPFNPETQDKAKAYLYRGLQVSICKGVVLVSLAFLVLELRLSTVSADWVQRYVSEPSLTLALLVLLGYGIFWLVSLPFDYGRGYVLEHKFGLSTERKLGWLGDNLKASLLSLLVALAFVEAAYNFMWLSPTYWWFLTWLVSALFIVLFVFAAPVVIMPLFYKFPKLKDEELLNSLMKLADKARIRVLGVFEMKAGVKTRKAIAGLTGIGRTRRMLISDTFLSRFSKDETESAMGHEIGHHIFGHAWKYTVLFTGAFLVMLFIADQILLVSSKFFGIQRFDYVASLPLLVLTLGLLYALFIPLANTISRRAEADCDQYTLELTEKPDAYISTMTKLCDQNLRYAYPSPITEFIFYDHPSGKKRIERALNYKRAHSPSRGAGYP
jgi:STE24 endopeptidase